MTVTNDDRRTGPYTATGGQTEFTFDFNVDDADDLTVTHEAASDGTITTLTEGAGNDFTVTLDGTAPNTGKITLTSGATANDKYTIEGNRTADRPTDFTTGGDFLAGTVNDAEDRQFWHLQEIARDIGRSFRLGPTAADGVSLQVVPEADKIPVWAADGLSLVNKAAADVSLTVVSSFINTLLDDADAATARATLGLIIGTDVEAADTDIVKADVAKRRTKGHPGDWYDIGGGSATTPTETSGSKTLDPDNGELQLVVINDSTTINPPATDDDCDIWLTIVQDSTGSRSVTFSGWNATKLPNSKDAVDGAADAESDVLIRVRGSVKKYGIYHNA